MSAPEQHYLFSYGSNSAKQLAERVGRDSSEFCTLRAHLPNHLRIFAGFSSNWGGGPASVVSCPSSIVAGSVVQMTEEELQRLDQFEFGYDRVQRSVVVDGFDSPIVAYMYVKLNHKYVSMPSASYLNAIYLNLRETCVPIYVLPDPQTDSQPVLTAIWEAGRGFTVLQAIEPITT